jgi:hypothetical protein
MRLSLCAALTAVLPLAIACSSASESTAPSARVEGSWYDPNEANPSGYCFHFQLQVQGNVVSGSGQYCWQPAVESLAVSGVTDGAALSLTFTGNLGTVVTWSGTTLGGTRMPGRATWVRYRGQPGGQTYPTTYLRQ